MAQLPTPIPGGNKVHIYTALSKRSFPTHMVGTDQNLGLTISTYMPVALKVSQVLNFMVFHPRPNLNPLAPQVVLESAKKEDSKRLLSTSQPSASAFKISDDDVLTFSPDDKQWKSVAKARSAANVNYDLASYHLCFEDYAEAAKCLAAIRGTPNAILETCDINVEALGGMFRDMPLNCISLS